MKLLKNIPLICLCLSFAATAAIAAQPNPVCSAQELEEINAAVMVKQTIVQGVEDRQKDTPLMQAVKKQDVAAVKKLLEQGADVNAKSGEYGVTPLMWAALRLNEDMVNAIIEKAGPQIDVSAVDGQGNTPIGFVYAGILNAKRNYFDKGKLSYEQFEYKKQKAKNIISQLNRLGIKETNMDKTVGGGKCAFLF